MFSLLFSEFRGEDAGGEGGNLEQNPDETSKPKGTKRNQVLRNKFFDSKQEIKESHPHIIEWFDNSRSRQVQTEIIEGCFKKNGGKLFLDLEKPCFRECKQRCVCKKHGSLYRT